MSKCSGWELMVDVVVLIFDEEIYLLKFIVMKNKLK